MFVCVARNAPVDLLGCEVLADPAAEPRIQKFHVLVALMLSSQVRLVEVPSSMPRHTHPSSMPHHTRHTYFMPRHAHLSYMPRSFHAPAVDGTPAPAAGAYPFFSLGPLHAMLTSDVLTAAQHVRKAL